MRAKITYADHSEPRFITINTLEDLIDLSKEENQDLIIERFKSKDCDIEIVVYNTYIE